MGSNLFKTRYLPNADGSDSNTALTNANTVFVHTFLGDDSTGDGTREKPYMSMTKACLKSVTYILFRGVVNEYFNSLSKYIIGDDINQIIILSDFSPVLKFGNLYNFTTKGEMLFYVNSLNRVIFDFTSYMYSTTSTFFYCYIKGIFGGIGSQGEFNHVTVEKLLNGGNRITNSIAVSLFEVPVTINIAYFRYSCILSTAVLKYNNINIIQPIFGNDSKANVTLLRSAFVAAGATVSAINTLLPLDSLGNETVHIIKQLKDGGISANIFSDYADTLSGTITAAITANQAKTSIQLTVADSSLFPTTGDVFIPNTAADGFEAFTYTSITINSPTLITFNGSSYTFKVAHSNGATCTRYGDVLDFTLNSDVTNEALWASDTGGYVGCFRPAESVTIDSGISIIDVNTDGSDTVNAGDLISVDANDNLVFNSVSAQIWNRLRDTSTISIPLGSNFKGLNAISQDGSPFGNYIGKKQNLIDSSVLNPGDALTVGTWYKIFNDVSKDVTKAIIYNGVQYLPSYTFLCITGVTVFSLLNSGSGSYAKKINVDVLESIEMLPYDDATTPSAFPKFSAPLMGECKLLYYTAAGATRYGKTAGNPVLFGDLAGTNFATDFPGCNDKIAYYDGYAISNADQEFFTLANPSLTSPKSTYFTTSIPILRFLRREINAHFDADYSY